MPTHIRVVTPITTRGFRRLDDLTALEGPGLRISHVEIDRGPASIEGELDEVLAAPDTVAKTIAAEQDGVDAVVIDCMGDPGMKAARECVSIPVLGPSQTAMHVAAMLGHTFSVVTVLQRLRVQFENLARLYGASDQLASVRAVDLPVLELEQDPGRTRALLVEQAVLAVEQDGAHAIVFGCTGMLGCAEAVRSGLLARGHDVPVIDPVPMAVRIAAALVEAGVSHSKLSHPTPQAKAVVGYDLPSRGPAAEAAD